MGTQSENEYENVVMIDLTNESDLIEPYGPKTASVTLDLTDEVNVENTMNAVNTTDAVMNIVNTTDAVMNIVNTTVAVMNIVNITDAVMNDIIRYFFDQQ
jgi:hypothetical protein